MLLPYTHPCHTWDLETVWSHKFQLPCSQRLRMHKLTSSDWNLGLGTHVNQPLSIMLAPVSLRSFECLPSGQRLKRSRSSIAIDRSKGSYDAPTSGFFPPWVKVQKLRIRWNLHLHPLTNLGWIFFKLNPSLKGLADEVMARGVHNSYLFLLKGKTKGMSHQLQVPLDDQLWNEVKFNQLYKSLYVGF